MRLSNEKSASRSRNLFIRPMVLVAGAAVLVAGLATEAKPRPKALHRPAVAAAVQKDTICVESSMGENCYPAKTRTETRVVKAGEMLPQCGLVGICKDQGFWVTKVDAAGIEVVYSIKQLVDVQSDRIRIGFGKPKVIGEYLLRAKITAKMGRAKGTAIVTVASTVADLPGPSDSSTNAALESLDSAGQGGFTTDSLDTNATK
ncbi:MAG: hypothetical protein PHV13_05915 [Candidatus ainarchaeum sp.]|nr:hypothetical protein [Candidatus ainarchaeum sp.]